MNSYVVLAAMFATPVFGWLCDRTGRYAPMLAFGALLLPVTIVIMSMTQVLWSTAGRRHQEAVTHQR